MRKAARESSKFNDESRLGEERQLAEYFVKAGLKITTPDVTSFRTSVDRQYAESGLAAKWMPGLKEKILAVK